MPSIQSYLRYAEYFKFLTFLLPTEIVTLFSWTEKKTLIQFAYSNFVAVLKYIDF